MPCIGALIAARSAPARRRISRPAPIVTPEDLQAHRCIGYRASGSRTLYKWEFERDTRMVNMATTGLLVLDNHTLPNMAALSAAGLAYAIEEAVPEHLEAGPGRLVRADRRLLSVLPQRTPDVFVARADRLRAQASSLDSTARPVLHALSRPQHRLFGVAAASLRQRS